MTGRLVYGYLLLLITTLFWAGAWITARIAAHDAPPLTVSAGRFLVASLLLLPALRWMDSGAPIRIDLSDRWVLLAMSFSGIMLYTVVFLVGIAFAPASDGALITPGLVGPFTLLIAGVFLRERPTSRVVAGTSTSLAGVLLVGWSAVQSAGTDSLRVFGDLLFVAAALTWSVYTLLGRKLADRVPAVRGIFVCSVLGCVLLTPLALVVEGVPDLSNWSGAAWVNVIYLGSFATAVAFVTYYRAVRIVGVGRAMPALGLVPLFGVLGAALLLGERLTVTHAVGGVLVVSGMLIPAIHGAASPGR